MLIIILLNNSRAPEPKDLSLFINKQAKRKKSSLCLTLMYKITKIYNEGILWNQDNLLLIRPRVSLGTPHTLEMMSVIREPQIG